MNHMKKKRNKLSIAGAADVLAIGLTVATIAGFLGRWHWTLDLFSHFRVQYMQLCLVLIGLVLWKRLNKRAVALILLACLNYAFVLPLYFGSPASTDGKPIRVMLMNLNAANGNADHVLKAIRNSDPDLVLFAEVTPAWAAELAVLDIDYTYRVTEPQEGCFGIMLMSKSPLERGEVVEIGMSGVPSIIAEAHFPQGTISIIGTHPLPPVNAECFRLRNSQLAALPETIKNQRYPVLLIGDLNTSSWSPHFRDLLRDSGLKNSMKGFGFQPTWPAKIPFMKTPLDHVLHSPEMTIHHRAVGKDVGSDHLPVIVDFSLQSD